MKNFTRQAFTTLLFLIFLATIHAQEKPHATPQDRATKMTEWMKSNLQLQDHQVAPVQTINLKYANKIHEVQTGPQTRTQKMRALKCDGEAMDQELKRVLTGEQFQAWVEKKEDVRQQWQEKMKAKKNGPY